MEQIALFDDEFVLLNDASAALMTMRADLALELLERYRALYPTGRNVERKVMIASFLQKGFAAMPSEARDRASHLFALWRSFEKRRPSLDPDGAAADGLLRPFFRKIADAAEEGALADGDVLAEGIPIGYAYLQTGECDRAIRSLQAALAVTPENAAIYGYLGDAYFARGDREAARQVYFEACLIDPSALDWRHLRDGDLQELLARMPGEYGFDSARACQWLPACAYVRGLFAPKRIRLREEFKAFTDRYLALKKSALQAPSPSLDASLFLQGIVLCDNEPFLRMIKGIDFADVRRTMKSAHPAIFAEYLKRIDRRTSSGR